MSAEIRQIRTAAETALAAHFAAARSSLPGPAAIAAFRDEAFHRFERDGLPSRRVEEWKYTDLRALMREAKPLAQARPLADRRRKDQAGGLLASIEARRIVFVNGALVPEFSDLAELEPGLAVTSMATTLASADPSVIARLGKTVPTGDIAVALNNAFMRDGAVIDVAPGTALTRPLHLVFFNEGREPAAVFLRSLVRIGENARVMLVESHEGSVGNQVNTALEFNVGDGAHLDHVKITAEGAGDLHLSSMLAAVGAHARFNAFLFTAGATVVRNQLFVRFQGEGTIAAIRGASLLKGHQHADTTLVADHAVGGCTARELFKSVVDGEAQSIFQGKIIVQPGAQKTDSKMSTHALLLSDGAETVNKPELEIFADDVQCGHGATSGNLDADLLFYLRARGIPEKDAQALLIQAFVGEAVEGIEHAGLRDCLMDEVVAWVKARN
jgi:Fe-S cluster assembly protein SufD